jgi:hypothetical protein
MTYLVIPLKVVHLSTGKDFCNVFFQGILMEAPQAERGPQERIKQPGFIEIRLSTPNRIIKLLSGSWCAVFEGFLHGKSPLDRY